jgi:DNA-binding response OmpR family regulator
MEEQRAIIEELLKDLIRTERRAIDAEDTLAARARATREMAVVDMRPPAVLLVERDRGVADQLAEQLEAAGLAAFAYVSGEEAIREAATLVETSGLDLALVAAELPGIDGLETVRLLRERVAGLPAYMLVSAAGEEHTAAAAELGIIGYVMKPIANLEQIVAHIAELARDSRHRTREALYLQRIKERHEHVLERYRSLPRAP